jgi:hypothetical protein
MNHINLGIWTYKAQFELLSYHAFSKLFSNLHPLPSYRDLPGDHKVRFGCPDRVMCYMSASILENRGMLMWLEP